MKKIYNIFYTIYYIYHFCLDVSGLVVLQLYITKDVLLMITQLISLHKVNYVTYDEKSYEDDNRSGFAFGKLMQAESEVYILKERPPKKRLHFFVTKFK